MDELASADESKWRFRMVASANRADQDRRADVRAHRAAADLPVAPDRADAAHPVDRAPDHEDAADARQATVAVDAADLHPQNAGQAHQSVVSDHAQRVFPNLVPALVAALKSGCS